MLAQETKQCDRYRQINRWLKLPFATSCDWWVVVESSLPLCIFCTRMLDSFITRLSRETLPNHLVFTVFFKPFIYISSKSLVNSICLFGLLANNLGYTSTSLTWAPTISTQGENIVDYIVACIVSYVMTPKITSKIPN